ncbi:type II/IV secretion system protein, partial [bacterium]
LRVSVLPNHHGQRIVLRILDKAAGVRQMSDLGFDAQDLALFSSLVAKPYGMFLVTGPTGSGKTTTLYAALGELSNEHNNVMTCEDPIEYEMDGVNQSQVNEKVGLNFAKQLRAILRQDPDVVLVGEVRDGETAETAIRAALTGHMVLSTLHCNDAPSAVPRLLDMGIDPFMLSTSLIGAMSQRLVRQLCTKCAAQSAPTDAELAIFRAYGVNAPLEVSRPVGCPDCENSGYRGRSAVHEILPIVPELQALIADRAPMVELRSAGARHGYRPMQRRALEMVAAGNTSMEEASRVVFLDASYAQSAPLRIAA